MKHHRTMSHSFRRYSEPRKLITACERLFGPVLDDFLATIIKHGKWAFVQIPTTRGGKIDRKRKAIIHWWASSRCPPSEIAMMLGHEFGHITSEPVRNDADEEDRADRYGEVARLVFNKLQRNRRPRQRERRR